MIIKKNILDLNQNEIFNQDKKMKQIVPAGSMYLTKIKYYK